MKDLLLDHEVDIRDLGVEVQPEPLEVFDSDKEISPLDWASIDGAIDYFASRSEEDKLFEQALEYCARSKMLGAQLPDLDWLTIGRINKKILSWYTDDNGSMQVSIDTSKIITLGQIIIIDPSFREKLKVDNFKGKFGEGLSALRKEHVFYPIDCFFARVVYGEEFREFKSDQGEPFYDPEAFRTGVKDFSLSDKSLEIFDLNSHYITNGLDMLVAQKVIEPEDRISFTPKQWRLLRHWLEGFRKENSWTQFLSLASSMYLLSAKRVDLTPEGFRLTFPEPSLDIKRIADIPAVRSYQ